MDGAELKLSGTTETEVYYDRAQGLIRMRSAADECLLEGLNPPTKPWYPTTAANMTYGALYAPDANETCPEWCPGVPVTFSMIAAFHIAERHSEMRRAFGQFCQGKRIMEVLINQIEGVKFSIQARTHTIICDQPQENGGIDAGMSPPEFLLASLGSCAAFYAAEYLRTRNLTRSGVEVSVSAEKLKGPARLGNFRIRVGCPVSLTSEQRDGLMRSVEHCLVKNTLLNPPQIEISLEIPTPVGVEI